MTDTQPQPATMTAGDDWQSIATMPEGIRVDVRHDDCPGYDNTAVRNGSRIDCASWFVRSDMAMITRPTHWRPARPEGLSMTSADKETMTTVDAPAFPNPALADESYRCKPGDEGMTLRDWFAGQWLAAGHHANLSAREAAVQAYQYADAMIAARSGGAA